jgi:hypothetical protein
LGESTCCGVQKIGEKPGKGHAMCSACRRQRFLNRQSQATEDCGDAARPRSGSAFVTTCRGTCCNVATGKQNKWVLSAALRPDRVRARENAIVSGKWEAGWLQASPLLPAVAKHLAVLAAS